MSDKEGEERRGEIETHGSLDKYYRALHVVATIVELLVGRLKWQSEIRDVLERLLIVHSLHISNTFDLRSNDNFLATRASLGVMEAKNIKARHR